MPTKTRAGEKPARRGYADAQGPHGVDPVRYGVADAELLRECIDAVTAAGDAIILGRTADSSAFSVRVLSDAGDGAWYPPTAEGLEGVLTRVIEVARGL